jgi:hypothetical protein
MHKRLTLDAGFFDPTCEFGLPALEVGLVDALDEGLLDALEDGLAAADGGFEDGLT